ncbi:4-(cytidine 5'-diphospho)-2-C-methyl-D-erythritol kinase [Microvirga antarctica]|uniref:4-(cytidine 5'-diphospho)-2-C-methyl-D-erythritol kinase n=1 Tax=Microvirga antarctica TaxID=2819233 RepID=UPI001B3144AA|nr:4-(cytidine 5'-diphospho)-2-C-methyl-D-erythritol kinase [Microvirga antarctica]
MSRPLVTRAPAKINLSLHVLGRRPDGYHELDSLVVFATTGDTLSLMPGPELVLEVTGPTASQAGGHADNLVIKAARQLGELVGGLKGGAFHLIKRLPVAAGIGGGSSDAAAALRLLARHNNLPLSHPVLREAARLTGADVPVCLEARARFMGGTGEVLGPALRLPRLSAVLVNPRVPVSTPEMFRALGLSVSSPAPPAIAPLTAASADDLLAVLQGMRNDLEAPACRLQPIIRESLDLLGQTPGCRLARMSGSGATVFGLFDDAASAAAAAARIGSQRPGWWVKPTTLR